jgi:hypothetical protein
MRGIGGTCTTAEQGADGDACNLAWLTITSRTEPLNYQETGFELHVVLSDSERANSGGKKVSYT